MTSASGSAPADRPRASAPDASTTAWSPDHLLDRYQVRTIPLGPDPDGEDPIRATLVRKPGAVPEPAGVVLYVHGFTDYFFHEPLADHFHDRGLAFYALDLRKCGRSRDEHHTPHYVSDLAYYDEELDKALEVIAEDFGDDVPVVVAAHSTGGLVTPLWLDRMRTERPRTHRRIAGLLLNSPWFDLQGKPLLRTPLVTAALKTVTVVAPKAIIPRELSGAYGESIHDSGRGEWSYDLALKPMGGFPVTFGFLNAVRDGQAALHRGLDVGVPSLVLRSDKTYFGESDPAAIDAADAVLDVRQIARWSGCLGDRVSAVPIPGARHDVFLSVPVSRERAYAEVDAWLPTLRTAGAGAGQPAGRS